MRVERVFHPRFAEYVLPADAGTDVRQPVRILPGDVGVVVLERSVKDRLGTPVERGGGAERAR
jgi:hypothetical protein